MVLDSSVADVQDKACGQRFCCLAVRNAEASSVGSLSDQGRHGLLQLLSNGLLRSGQRGDVSDGRRSLFLVLARLAPLLVLCVLFRNRLVSALLA